MGKDYAKACCAHQIANTLNIEFGAAWRVSQCVNKMRFNTEEEAWEAAEKWSGTCPQRPYKCDICSRWHLTREDGCNE